MKPESNPTLCGSTTDPDRGKQHVRDEDSLQTEIWSALEYFPGRPYVPGAVISGQFEPERNESPECFFYPLQRFLPQLLPGAVQAYLRTYPPPGKWILDPFGVAPHLPVEMAQAGYRVLVTSHNPIARFLIELCAQPPAAEQLQAALAALAALPRGEERLEQHLKNLYLTQCAQCSNQIIAEAFIWERGADAPSSRIYHCPFCDDQGEHPATEADVQLVQQTRLSPLHYARALERVAPLHDPDRANVGEALAMYTPRALYVLITLINRLDSLPPERRRLIEAILLPVFDQSCALWPHPAVRYRPLQLTRPPRYQEKNIWLALERAIYTSAEWARSSTSLTNSAVPLTSWPELPPESGGICLFPGRLKDLLEQNVPLPDQRLPLRFQAIIAAVPRPNQAFWTLSALWAGWLWGSQAVTPFKSVLRRRRYDWAWHATGLQATLIRAAPLLEPGGVVWLLAAECEPSFLTALLLAGNIPSLSLSGIAIRHPNDPVQVRWRVSSAAPPSVPDLDSEIAVSIAAQAAAKYLQMRGEPAGYLLLQAAALTGMLKNDLTGPAEQVPTRDNSVSDKKAPPSPADSWNQLQAVHRQALSHLHGFFRFGGSRSSPESGIWWHNQLVSNEKQTYVQDQTHQRGSEWLSLSDRVEMELVRCLIQQPGSTTTALETGLNATFRGLFTPRADLIYEILSSYGEEQPPGTDCWQLRSQELPAARRNDLRLIASLLIKLGEQLGCQSTILREKTPLPQNPVLWKTPAGQSVAVFYPLASAILSRIIYENTLSPDVVPETTMRRVIVIPGSRARLIEFKLRHDPRLRQSIEEKWTLIKFRHVRRLAENPLLTLENLDENLHLDPLANTDPQIPLW